MKCLLLEGFVRSASFTNSYCCGGEMTTPSASDMTKLFIALGEQTRALVGRQKSSIVPDNLVQQFNMLADAANQNANIKIHKITGSRLVYADDFLAQVGVAAQIAGARGDSSRAGDSSNVAVQINSDAGEIRPAKPRVFIGCSLEGLRYAKIIQLQLAPATRTRIWNQGVFGLSSGTLESLVAERGNFDYAVLILTPDDTRIRRDKEGPIPRDNVIFELGLFMGALGRERVFMVVRKGTELPTDLAGILPAVFDHEEELNIVSTLGPITTMLEIAMDLI